MPQGRAWFHRSAFTVNRQEEFHEDVLEIVDFNGPWEAVALVDAAPWVDGEAPREIYMEVEGSLQGQGSRETEGQKRPGIFVEFADSPDCAPDLEQDPHHVSSSDPRLLLQSFKQQHKKSL